MKLIYTEVKDSRVTQSEVIGTFATFDELSALIQQEIDTYRKYESMDAANKLTQWVTTSKPLQFKYYDGSIGTWEITI